MRSNRLITVFLLAGMVLGTYQGHLALWNDSNPEPLTVYPRLVTMLPEADQQQLREGIPIENESRLHRLLEDYLS